MATCSQKVHLLAKCRGLADDDIASKSDPFVTIADERGGKLGQTETIMNCLNPEFKKAIEVDYYFETKQSMTLTVWDYDKDGAHDNLGTASFTMGQLMSSRGGMLTLKLSRKGEVTLAGLPVGSERGIMKFKFHGKQLKNMDTLGKSDPFFVLARIMPDGSRRELYKSEVVDNNLNPQWKPCPAIDSADVCSGNFDTPSVLFQCFDEDVSGNDAMGEFKCTARQLLQAGAEFKLVGPKGENDVFGFVTVASAVYEPSPSFAKLLQQGLQLNIAFSIDFTGSNLDPSNPKSLHYAHPTQPNQYIRSMISISDVVSEYDTDKNFPVFGFGAMLPGTSDANHFFHVNLGAPNPYLQGMQSVINCYSDTVKKVRLYGPTNFAPTITNVTAGARGARDVYTILLIMTDGEITDMGDTMDAIVRADDAPISILIIGVGAADFSSMSQLDGDGQRLRGAGRVCRRDLVQFVPMRDFLARPHGDLAAELLREVPGQVEAWAKLTNYVPVPVPK
jgi:hypothetical protein